MRSEKAIHNLILMLTAFIIFYSIALIGLLVYQVIIADTMMDFFMYK